MNRLIGAAILLAVIGAFDAVRGDHWDQFAILIAVALLLWAALAVSPRRSQVVAPRPDLMDWLDEFAALTDDEPDRVADRALAAYRSQMVPGAPDLDRR